ncbi:MAG TPA: helix-turn-helix transcriptional regulator [Firmicutes bacterium]|nr:helix-turn-helix transcriptional regulator [Bacillota bacterium]
MPSIFGDYIDEKRKGRADGGGDILLKDIAKVMGMSATYVTDILKGRRYPPDLNILNKIAEVLKLSSDEKEIMFDLAGRERNEASLDLTDYIMNENTPHLRIALRKAKRKNLGDDFWKTVVEKIDG